VEHYDAFVSYSRADKELVRAIVNLLQVGRRRVFWDANEIMPGDRWAERIADAIHNSSTVVILWCCHSARSTFVIDEVNQAMEAFNSLVPVLLCSFPVSPPMADYQWIDCRELVRHTCQDHGSGGQLPPNTSDVVSFLTEADLSSAESAETWGRSLEFSRMPRRIPIGAHFRSVFLGVILLLLVVLRPFTSPLPVDLILTLNTIVALCGAALLAYSSVRVFGYRSAKSQKLDGAARTLALVIEVAVRRAQMRSIARSR
jgi:hypothetical protein